MEQTILRKEEESGRGVGRKDRKRRRADRDITHANMKSDSCQLSVLIARNLDCLFRMLVPVFDDFTQHQTTPSSFLCEPDFEHFEHVSDSLTGSKETDLML